ncbi:DNA-binding transcriptional LysR family regulator [Paraburkholderia sp. BL27I4N3]|uniref:LysR family transcriptional regulator n=1 Tax=Paraburkholderia sp. BL27I4N3 TaxID=1938805 RepID=UPI000E224EBE|nr:LysR family transcriptional regulator [Paraburkholderia sp. BL27I4N3]REE23624.1 DNA-binding transcriptional LysR family regulator [Paraburkholderia sp. BL27I4N3]
MRIEDLHVFSVLAETRNLHRVAQKTGLTQSAVSKILQRLETEFDTRLVDRTGRGVELTAAGRVLVERAADVGASVAQTYADMSAAKSASAGKIRIGVVPALLESALLPILARYTARESTVSFRLSVQVSALLFDELKDGQLDLALCFTPQTVADEELQSDDIGSQRYRIVARQGHPLAHTPADPRLLQAANWLLPLPGHGLRQIVDRYFQDHDLASPQAVIETDASISLLTSLLRNSDLITMLTEQMLQTYAGRDLAALPYETALFESKVRLFYRRKTPMSPAVRRFRSTLREALTDS